MRITIQLSTGSAEMIGKICETIGVSPTVVVNRMVNSQLEGWNSLYEYLNPAGSSLEPEQDFAELHEQTYPPYQKIYGPGDKAE
jgi:hypothetical protein